MLTIPDHAQGAAIGGGGLWIARSDWSWGTLDRLDVEIGAPQRRYAIAPGTEGIAFGSAGRLWAVSEAGSRHIYDYPFRTVFPVGLRARPRSLGVIRRLARGDAVFAGYDILLMRSAVFPAWFVLGAVHRTGSHPRQRLAEHVYAGASRPGLLRIGEARLPPTRCSSYTTVHHFPPVFSTKYLRARAALPICNLSAIAERITGVLWSGPRFFGLTKRTGASLGTAAGQ